MPATASHPVPPAAAAPRLIIKKALYGDLPDGTFVDVTKKLAELVAGDSLTVGDFNVTFGDPAPNIIKTLRVDYTFDGRDKSKTAGEYEILTISNTGD